jgi:peptidoglycan/LPS O-acetylase OafA/YrhL
MNPTSPLPAVAALLLALATAFLLMKRFGAPPEQGRHVSIDGLRGYLALGVFLHHSCIWYFYLKTEAWDAPPSNLYNHFGQSSVAIFFMITGFLFFSKLLDGRHKDIDWGRLYIGRLLRLAPLYVFSILLMVGVVLYMSGGVLREPLGTLLKGVSRWLMFTIFSAPDLNGLAHTFTITAGVTWTLPYEWKFYLALPLLALIVGKKPPLPYLLIGVVSASKLLFLDPSIQILLPFFGGILACFIVKLAPFQRVARSWLGSLLSIGCVMAAVVFFRSAYSIIPLALLFGTFALTASGNSLFGVLTNPLSRILGEMTYSIYLLQGILLYVVFNIVLDPAVSKSLSAAAHWGLIMAATPVLVIGSFITFRFIETPAMQSTARLTGWLRSRKEIGAEPAAASATL